MTQFELKIVTKINLRITAKCNAHLQILTKTPAKFKKDPLKTAGVAFTRYQVSICVGRSFAKKLKK